MGVPRVPDPEWIVTLYDDPKPRNVAFKDLYAQKENISSMMLLWNFHSFYVNVQEGYFIINGGRRLRPHPIESLDKKQILYARRNAMDVTVAGDEMDQSEIRTSFLLGVRGKLDEEDREIMIQIAPDGSAWVWRNHR